MKWERLAVLIFLLTVGVDFVVCKHVANAEERDGKQESASDEARRAAALAQGQQLRAQAKRRAHNRARAKVTGMAIEDGGKETRKGKPRLPKELTRIQRRALEKADRRVMRHRAFLEAEKKLEEDQKLNGKKRRQLVDVDEAPTCSDGRMTPQFDTDVDCGGQCRTQFSIHRGMRFPKLCEHGKRCETAVDCLSGICKASTCGKREAFRIKSNKELERNMHRAFFTIAEKKLSDTIGSADTDEFFNLVFNPDKNEMDENLKEVFDSAVELFKIEQGLRAPGVTLHYGFLMRGQCMAFAKGMIESLRK